MDNSETSLDFGKFFRRGGFLASAAEQFLKLDLSKWLKVVRDLDLLPKMLDQDWSSIWLQKFDGTVTILVSLKARKRESMIVYF